MGNLNLKTIVLALAMAVTGLTSCGSDEPEMPKSNTTTTSSSSKITKPTFDKYLTTTTTSGFSVRVRFKTGGDSESNMSATVHWRAYSSKQASKPSKLSLTNTESMRQYGSATYHNTGSKRGMTESIVFDKSHAGSTGGTYIYYYVECRNSKGSAETPVSYTVVKR